jgi:hypothetical protein
MKLLLLTVKHKKKLPYDKLKTLIFMGRGSSMDPVIQERRPAGIEAGNKSF